MKIKSYKVFYTDVREHLINYLEKTQNGKTEGIIPGIWPNNGKEYKHILNIEKGKVLAIQRYNLLRCVSHLPFILEGKSLHQFAHHLNSSQVMCYNFFRPQLDDNKLVKEPLIKLLNDLGVIFDESNICAKADFEYEEPRTEEPDRKTNFDFFVKMGETKVYFEIKYTENGFGSCDYDEDPQNTHKAKFDKFYKEQMERCGLFKKEASKWNKTFCNYYQLIRNAIRINDNSFVVIISDARNRNTKNQFEHFKNDMLLSENHLIHIHWQDLCKKARISGFSKDHLDEFEAKNLNEY